MQAPHHPRRLLPLALLQLALICAGSARAEAEPKVYTNLKYGYSIEYPAELLPQGEPDAGDGQKFLSADGRAALLVWAGYNIEEASLPELYARALREMAEGPRRVTYKLLKADWFVISGFEEDQIFYRKTLLQSGTIYSFELEYPQAKKPFFDPLVGRLGASLRPVRVQVDPASAD